ncbi:FG-GAP repeat domain-containing protein [Candidatus Electrothrix sp.]|uniref:FG-GAP repeat domain-containing protein n=1 Tax=Candidatus Electrothrix sp. TaxID=2170559 RepID=UPI0040578009
MNSYHCPFFALRLRTRAPLLLYVHVILITCFGTIATLPSTGQSTEPASSIQNTQHEIIIPPFTVQTTTPQPHLQTGLANILATRITRKTGHIVTSQSTGTDKLTNLLRQQDYAAVQKIIQKMENTSLLAGTLQEKKQGYRIIIHAFDHRSTAHISISQSFNRLDQALSALDELSLDIAEKIFSIPRPEKPHPVAESNGLEGFHTAHPERLFKEKKYNEVNQDILEPVEIKKREFGILSSKKMIFLSSKPLAMAVGDLNNDGTEEFVILERANIVLYHKRPDASFQRIAFQPLARHLGLHTVHLADLDNNGLQEIYIGASNGTTPASQILEWDGTFRVLYQNAPYYLRPGVDTEGRPILLGQENVFQENGSRAFYSLQRKANTSLKKVQRITVPSGFNIYDFLRVDLDLDGDLEFVGITRSNKLTVINNTGQTVWKSEKNYGASKEILGTLSRTIDGDRYQSNNPESVYMHTRIMTQDLNSDGAPEIILGRNRLLAKITFFKRLRSFEGSSITALSWDGNTMSTFWESPKVQNYTIDFHMLHRQNQPHTFTLFSLEQEYSGNLIPFWNGTKESLLRTYTLEKKKD